MENYETHIDNTDSFDEILLAFSENEDEVEIGNECPQDERLFDITEFTAEELLEGIEQMFSDFSMNEHLATVNLLGDLGYSDMLMYYCIVTDCLFISEETEPEEKQVITPADFVREKNAINDKEFAFELCFSKSKLIKLNKLLNYFKSKEFKILSNTFYIDGSDFVLVLNLKATLDYRMKVKIVFKCDSDEDAFSMSENFGKIQPCYVGKEDNNE